MFITSETSFKLKKPYKSKPVPKPTIRIKRNRIVNNEVGIYFTFLLFNNW